MMRHLNQSNLYIQTWKKSIFNRLKKPFLCLTALWFILSDCKDIIVVVVPAGYEESVIIHLYMYQMQRKSQLGRLVNVIVVAPLRIYYIGPGETIVWTDIKFPESSIWAPPFYSSTPFKLRIDHVTENIVPMACTYLRIILLEYDGKEKDVPIGSLVPYPNFYDHRSSYRPSYSYRYYRDYCAYQY